MTYRNEGDAFELYCWERSHGDVVDGPFVGGEPVGHLTRDQISSIFGGDSEATDEERYLEAEWRSAHMDRMESRGGCDLNLIYSDEIPF
jgi:hypothetical protein